MYLSEFKRLKHLYANDIETVQIFAYERRNSFELQTIVCKLYMLIYMIYAHKPAETRFPKQVSVGMAFN